MNQRIDKKNIQTISNANYVENVKNKSWGAVSHLGIRVYGVPGSTLPTPRKGDPFLGVGSPFLGTKNVDYFLIQ